ncbi:MAG: outer membrane beta-barrel protein [Cyclobacteriaceae bacterium]
MLSIIYNFSFGQSQNPPAQPDLPGMLLFDYGVNLMQNNSEDFDIRIIRSRTVGIHYLYDIPLGETQFSFHPGFGFSSQNFTFTDPVTLNFADSTEVVPLAAAEYPGVDKSKLSVHYINIPLEFRFFAQEDNRGFTAGLGGFVGRRMLSYTKIKFDEDKVDKYKRDFNLNPWRYGVHARVGFRGIMLTGQYAVSPLFMEDEGPEGNVLTVGLTISLF